jgi:hypothetical protein
MRIPNLRPLTDSKLFWQRMVLYSKRLSPRLRWQEAAGFEDVWPAARERTVVDEGSAHMLFQLARHASKLEGMFAEVGVYRGGTAKLLAGIADRAGRELHLFDTFAGMPETDRARDLHTAGDFADTSLAGVQAFLAGHRSPKFHQGEFPGTVPAAGVEAAKFSLVHVDADIASSVGACCEFFYPRLVPGGVMIFDDYGHTSCPGAKTATDGFFADKPEPVLHLLTSQALIVKLP